MKTYWYIYDKGTKDPFEGIGEAIQSYQSNKGIHRRTLDNMDIIYKPSDSHRSNFSSANIDGVILNCELTEGLDYYIKPALASKQGKVLSVEEFLEEIDD